MFFIVTNLVSVPLAARLQGQEKIDSLVSALPQHKEDTFKVRLLKSISFNYSSINPNEGIKYGLQCLKLANKLQWKVGIAWANSTLGNNYESQSDYPKAMGYYFAALRIYEELGNDEGAASALGNLGNVYFYNGDFEKALEFELKALSIYEKIGSENGVDAMNLNIGLVYQNQNDYEHALKYFFKALKSDMKKGDKSAIGTDLGNIGTVYILQHNFVDGIDYLHRALQLHEEIGDKRGMALMLGNIGESYALSVADTMAVVEATDTGRIRQRKVRRAQRADLSKHPALLRANEYLQKAIAVNIALGDVYHLRGNYASMAYNDSLLGDFRGAFEAYKLYTLYKDSVFSEEEKTEMVRMSMLRKMEVDSMKNERDRAVANIRYRQQRGYTILGIVGVVLLMGFSVVIAKARARSEAERKKSDELLLNILPAQVADELKNSGTTVARQYDHVTVMLTDFVNFTQAVEKMQPQALIDELDVCFRAFDEIMGRYGIEKIKTIGDAYLAVSGLPKADKQHAEKTILAAIEIKRFVSERLAMNSAEGAFAVRIGINSGSVVAGVVGVKKFAYDIWGDTVNTAARMEQNSAAGRINISEATYELVKNKIPCTSRGMVEVKGKGLLHMYYVNDEAVTV